MIRCDDCGGDYPEGDMAGQGPLDTSRQCLACFVKDWEIQRHQKTEIDVLWEEFVAEQAIKQA